MTMTMTMTWGFSNVSLRRERQRSEMEVQSPVGMLSWGRDRRQIFKCLVTISINHPQCGPTVCSGIWVCTNRGKKEVQMRREQQKSEKQRRKKNRIKGRNNSNRIVISFFLFFYSRYIYWEKTGVVNEISCGLVVFSINKFLIFAPPFFRTRHFFFFIGNNNRNSSSCHSYRPHADLTNFNLHVF